MSDLEMWEYWRDKHGYERAITNQYAELYVEDLTLQHYVRKIKDAKMCLDSYMQELQRKEENDHT